MCTRLRRQSVPIGAAGHIARPFAEAHRLAEPFTIESAGDWLAAMGSVLLWEELTKDFGWTTDRYVHHLQAMFRGTLLKTQTAD